MKLFACCYKNENEVSKVCEEKEINMKNLITKKREEKCKANEMKLIQFIALDIDEML